MSKILQVFLIFLCFCLLVSAEQPKTVHNGVSPKGKRVTLKLTEEVRFGPDQGGEDFIWTGADVRVQVNKAGHMFIVDPVGRRLLEFDGNGKFVRLVGGPGEGPGEFQLLQSFYILADDSGMAFGSLGNTNSISIFDSKMKFVKRDNMQPGSQAVNTMFVSPDGKSKAGMTLEFTRNGRMIIRYGLYDAKASISDAILTLDVLQFSGTRVRERSFWVDFLADQLGPAGRGEVGYFAFDKSNNVYMAVGKEYKITRASAAGKKNMVITRDYKPITRTEKEVMAFANPVRDALLAQLPASLHNMLSMKVLEDSLVAAEFPPKAPPIEGLICMEDGSLIVIHRINGVTGMGLGDIFDKNGAYLGSFKHPAFGLGRMTFSGGYAYTIETNEDEENECVRYKVDLVPAG